MAQGQYFATRVRLESVQPLYGNVVLVPDAKWGFYKSTQTNGLQSVKLEFSCPTAGAGKIYN